MLNFIHKLLNPHCPHCAVEVDTIREMERQSRACPSCDILKMELEKSQRRERLLLDRVISQPEQVNSQTLPDETNGKMPVMVPRSNLWRRTQQDLERESLKAAEKIRQDKIAELEHVVLPSHEDKPDAS